MVGCTIQFSHIEAHTTGATTTKRGLPCLWPADESKGTDHDLY